MRTRVCLHVDAELEGDGNRYSDLGKYLYKPEFCEPRPPFQWARAFTWRCQVNGARLRRCLRSVQGESFRERVGRKQKSLPLGLSCRIRVRLGSRFLSVLFAGETDEAKEKKAHSGNQMGPDRVSVESTWRRLPDRSPWFNCSQRIPAGPPPRAGTEPAPWAEQWRGPCLCTEGLLGLNKKCSEEMGHHEASSPRFSKDPSREPQEEYLPQSSGLRRRGIWAGTC